MTATLAQVRADPAEPPRSLNPTDRTVRSIVALATFVLFAVAGLSGQTMFVLVAGFAALVYGVGSAAALIAAPRSVDLGAAGAIGLGLAVMLLGPLVMVITTAWHPQLYVWTVVVLAVLAHLAVLADSARRRELGPLVRAGLRAVNPRAAAGLPELLALVCVVAFWYAIAHAHTLHLHGSFAIGGYLRVVGVGWYLALAVLVCAVAYYAWRGLALGVLFAGLQLLIALFAVTWLAYDAPRSQTAEKHIALVQLTMRQGSLDGVIPIYKSWPAFFSGSAAALQGFGAGSQSFGPTWDIAVIWPLLVALTSFALYTSLCRIVGYPWVTAYVLATLAAIANVLQQDYYSPQSTGYLLAVATFTVCFARPRRRAALVAESGGIGFPSRLHLGFVVTWRQVVVAAVLATSIATTHQFTPFAVVGAVGLFFVLGGFRPLRRGVVLALVVAIPAGAWTLAHSSAVGQFLNPTQIGDPKNFTAPRLTPVDGAHRMIEVYASAGCVVATLVLVGLVGLTGGLPRLKNRVTLAMGGSVLVGFALIVVSPYGQEGIYRASLFALPWLIMLGQPVWHRLATGARVAHLVLAGFLAALTAFYICSSAALDASNVVRRADVVAYDYVDKLARAHPDHDYVVIQMGLGDGPWQGATQPPNLATLRSSESIQPFTGPNAGQEYLNQSFETAISYLGRPDPSRVTIFVIFSPANIAYTTEWALGLPRDLAQIRAALSTRANGTVRLVPIGPGKYLGGDGTSFAQVDQSAVRALNP